MMIIPSVFYTMIMPFTTHVLLLKPLKMLCATGTFAALMAIGRNEGVGALYAGVWLTWVKQAPQYAVTFLCYDLAKAWLAAENGNGKHAVQAEAEDIPPVGQKQIAAAAH